MIGLLQAFCKNKFIEYLILSSPTHEFPKLLNFFLDHLSMFPEAIHEVLIQTLTTMAFDCPEENLGSQMIRGIMDGIGSRFKGILSMNQFTLNFQKHEVISTLEACLEVRWVIFFIFDSREI